MRERKQRDRKIRLQILDLQDKHCETCEIKEKFQEQYSGHDYQQNMIRYCLNDCSIGQKMQELGAKILETRPVINAVMRETVDEEEPKILREKWIFKIPKVKEVGKVKKELTKEVYLQERIDGKSNAQIEREYGLKPNYIYAKLKDWGLSAKEVTAMVKKNKPVSQVVNPVAPEPKEAIVKEPVELAVQESSDSFIQATIERDQQILAKAVPKKSGRSFTINTTDLSLVIEEELRALLGYVQAMPEKSYKLEISLVEVTADA